MGGNDMQAKGFCAIRRDTYDGHLWLDTSTWGLLRTIVEDRCNDAYLAAPLWARCHPVIAIVSSDMVVTDDERLREIMHPLATSLSEVSA